MARRVIAMRFGVDDEAHRQRGQLLHGRHDVAQLDRVLPGVDHDDAFVGDNDAAVGVKAVAGVDVDAVGKLLDPRPQILSERGARHAQTRRQSPAALTRLS